MSTPARWVGFGCAAARVCCAARECWPARCTAARSPPHLLTPSRCIVLAHHCLLLLPSSSPILRASKISKPLHTLHARACMHGGPPAKAPRPCQRAAPALHPAASVGGAHSSSGCLALVCCSKCLSVVQQLEGGGARPLQRRLHVIEAAAARDHAVGVHQSQQQLLGLCARSGGVRGVQGRGG